MTIGTHTGHASLEGCLDDTADDRAPGHDYQADLEFDFANEDQTGLIWTWLDHARDESVVLPGAVLILRDGEDFAMGQVADLVRQDQGTVVHLRLLPGTVEDYHAAFERATPRSA